MLKKDRQTITLPELWYICTQSMWGNSFVHTLDKFLKSHNINTILDCSGGVGFPCIALKKMGWNITYSDGSKKMFEFFKKQLSKEKIRVPHYLVNWLKLSKRTSKKYSAVLCRGNSLIYVDSWDGKNIQKQTRKNIKRSLQEFYKVLHKGGLLYVDIMSKKEFNQPKYPIFEKFKEKIINGKRIKLVWKISHDYTARKRTWQVIALINNTRHQFPVYSSYILYHKELVAMMKDIGFRNIKNIKIKGENNYDVFVGFK